ARLVEQEHTAFEGASAFMHEEQVEGEEPLEALRALLEADQTDVGIVLYHGEELLPVGAELHFVLSLLPPSSDIPGERLGSVVEVVLMLFAVALVALLVLRLKVEPRQGQDHH